MPSINRLVFLAVLSLSVYVQSAPVDDAAGAKLARTIVVTERDVVAAELVARVIDNEDVEDDDELELEGREFDEEIEARAPTKASCPVRKSAATKTTAKTTPVARAYEYVAHLFERDNQEFIGWHGTNSDTATFWASKGQLEKPVKADGFFDFIGLGPKSNSGTSGADAELGPGVYVTDDHEIAIAFANNNTQVNPGTTAQLCAIFAKESSNWRKVIRKAFIPENLVGDSSNPDRKTSLEAARITHIKAAVPGVSVPSVVKFSLLNRDIKPPTGQLVLPALITSQLTAQCFNAGGGVVAAGTSMFPEFTYNGDKLRAQWNIAAETAGQQPVARTSAPGAPECI
ncbi:hypothetical protein B0H19DRAFT_1269353 [Mycena capillaripes]|nr:hypothetical protein B0H19DRAFT_1269353 [Mycena capillaripes]